MTRPIGERLVEWRERHDMTQRAAASVLNVSCATIQRYEAGEDVGGDAMGRRLMHKMRRVDVEAGKAVDEVRADAYTVLADAIAEAGHSTREAATRMRCVEGTLKRWINGGQPNRRRAAAISNYVQSYAPGCWARLTNATSTAAPSARTPEQRSVPTVPAPTQQVEPTPLDLIAEAQRAAEALTSARADVRVAEGMLARRKREVADAETRLNDLLARLKDAL